MAAPKQVFFRATSEAIDRMSELFDFVWPTAAALANMRDQSSRLIGSSYSNAEELLRKEFAVSEFPRAALFPGWVQTSWDDQRRMIAQVTLVNVFAIYEGWVDDLVDTLDGPLYSKLGDRRRFIDALQFHAKPNRDWPWAMGHLRSFQSPDLEAAFGGRLRKTPVVANGNVDALLKCYRYFKEIRNALMHRNGRANKWLVQAQAAYLPVSDKSILNMKVAPKDPNPVLAEGDRVELSLYGVAGFNDVCRQLMLIADVNAGMTIFGEQALSRTLIQNPPARSKSGHRKSTLGRMADAVGLRVEDHEAFARVLLAHNVPIP